MRSDVHWLTQALTRLVAGSSARLQSLSLGDCALLTDDAVVGVVRTCTALQKLDLSGLELITDDTLLAISEALPTLESLNLRRCVQLSDSAVERVARGCAGSLRNLCLNNVPAIGDASIAALREHCASSLEVRSVRTRKGSRLSF